MNNAYPCFASSAFGMEGLVAAELRKLGSGDVLAENGGVCFSASGEELFTCNLAMHYSDRLYIVLADAECRTFDQLFRLVQSVDWTRFFTGPESIDISCKCTRSTLMSPRDCQSITKKAVIEMIRSATGQGVFPEDGPSLSVSVTVRNDRVRIMLNTSGEALSRRGYRTWNGEAPLRETLASALVELSGWKPGQPLHDPCCGTGTILVEAALRAAGRAPGIRRHFLMEDIRCFRSVPFDRIRRSLEGAADMGRVKDISGSDIDQDALILAGRHVRQAGLDPAAVRLENIRLQDLQLDETHGVFICNPPYGERLSDQKNCRALYHDLYQLQRRHPTWRLCAISSDPAFERSYGKRAARKRRLYNGRLECVYYIFDSLER